MKKYLVLFLLFSPFAGISQNTQNQSFKIYSTAGQKQVSLDDILLDLDRTDVLFYGEEHNDSIGHTIELALFKKIVDKYLGKAALSLEMFETDVQLVLNEYLQGLIREKKLLTDARAWPSYNKDYRPLVELAKSSNVPVVAANAPSRYTNMVSGAGLDNLLKLNKTALSYLPPLPIDTAAGAYYEKFVKTMGGHSAMAGMGSMKIYQSQNLWDATMAWSIARFYKNHKNYKLLNINGGFHSEEKLGIIAQLKKYAPKARVLNINAYAEKNFDNPNWAQYQQNADYIILTKGK